MERERAGPQYIVEGCSQEGRAERLAYAKTVRHFCHRITSSTYDLRDDVNSCQELGFSCWLSPHLGIFGSSSSIDILRRNPAYNYSVTAKIGDGNPMVGLLQVSGIRGWLRSTCVNKSSIRRRMLDDFASRTRYAVRVGKPNAASDNTDKTGVHAAWRDALVFVVSWERQI